MAIPFEQKLIAVLFSLTLLLVTLQLIRKHKLREEYALVWFAASLAIFIFSVFDGLIRNIAAQFGVTYAPTLILVIGLLFCVVMLLAQTVMLSTQANRIRDLAQFVAVLDSRVDQTERGRTPQTNGFLHEVQIRQEAIESVSADQHETEQNELEST